MDKQIKERIDFIRKCPYFEGMEEPLLDEIAQRLVEKKYPEGEVINWEGETSGGIYFVKNGWLKVTKSSEKGRELILNLLQKGDLFNLISVFSNNLNPATVVVLEKTVLYFLDGEVLRQLAVSTQDLCLALLRQLADRVRSLTELAGHLSLSTVEDRIARWLLDASSGEVVKRSKWLTQNEMAAIIGTVPDVISRILRDFIVDGLIRFNRREIRIIDREGLAAKIRNLS